MTACLGVLVLLFFVAVISAAIGAAIGEAKGRPGLGAVLSLLVGPIGWLVVAMLPSAQEAGPLCPHCGGVTVSGAAVCKNCGRDLPPPLPVIAQPAPTPWSKRDRMAVTWLVVFGIVILLAVGLLGRAPRASTANVATVPATAPTVLPTTAPVQGKPSAPATAADAPRPESAPDLDQVSRDHAADVERKRARLQRAAEERAEEARRHEEVDRGRAAHNALWVNERRPLFMAAINKLTDAATELSRPNPDAAWACAVGQAVYDRLAEPAINLRSALDGAQALDALHRTLATCSAVAARWIIASYAEAAQALKRLLDLAPAPQEQPAGVP
jgi:hypothetical protein